MEKLLLGIIQGLTEFLPVSSSGHLAIFGKLLKDVNLSFFILLHLATLIAVIWFLRHYIVELIIRFFKLEKKALMIVLYVVISTIPAAILGLIFNNQIEKAFTKDSMIAIFLSITGLTLFISDFRKEGSLNIEKLGFLNALIIGIFQSFALLPGISRSGMTLVAALLIGLNRKEAIKYSFLISIPAILGAFVLESGGLKISGWSVIGFLGALIVGLASLYFLRFLTLKKKLRYFSYYCWVISALIFLNIL